MKNLIQNRAEIRDRDLPNLKQEWRSVQSIQCKIILLQYLFQPSSAVAKPEEKKMWKKMAGASTSETSVNF
jgi:hypothetical protein